MTLGLTMRQQFGDGQAQFAIAIGSLNGRTVCIYRAASFGMNFRRFNGSFAKE
jgi:hypothetical protein